MVPRAGLEPAQTCVRRILSPLRLPFRHPGTIMSLEAAPGFEPGIKVLQTHALPLGYAAIAMCVKNIQVLITVSKKPEKAIPKD